MNDRTMKTPGPDHPITIAPNPRRVLVKIGGTVIADTTRALSLREATYPVVQYIPRDDIDMSALQRTDTRTFCPYKGDASYFSIAGGGDRSTDAVWSYEQPHEAVAEIADHLAFYLDRAVSIEEQG